MAAFTAEVLKQLEDELARLDGDYETLLMAFIRRTFKNPKANEYAHHGFGRRVSTQVRCIKNVFRALPPERDSLPTRDELQDAQISLQSFVLNTFGALDNLAWIWVLEKDVRDNKGGALTKFDVGLSKKRKHVRASFSQAFRDYLSTVDPWLDAMEDYRDGLAHRIPLYIPPFNLTPSKKIQYDALESQMEVALIAHKFDEYAQLEAEQAALCTFMPVMTHSYEEKAKPMVFHAQMFADFKTIHELGTRLLGEL